MEEKQFVLLDRATDRIAKLVAGEAGLRDVLGIVIISVRSQRSIAAELIDSAVKIVRAGFGGDVDDARSRPPVFRRKIIRQYIDFLRNPTAPFGPRWR